MSQDLTSLVEKLTATEPITLQDWENLLNAYRDAIADGRITIREGLRLAFAIIAILKDFVDVKSSSDSDVNFGF